jgi:outer membrane receptor protein involved in Fe transport
MVHGRLWRRWWVVAGVGGALLPGVAVAATCPRGRVVDGSGVAIAGAAVVGDGPGGHQERVMADATGNFVLQCSAGWDATARLRASAAGVASRELVGASGDTVLVVRPRAVAEQVTVTATRSGVALGPQAETVVALDAGQMLRFPALTLDERLRQVAGFELFRRASSWVANPTSQGVSLRGLGSTAASRSLVLVEGAPLNDPFGDWVHWNEIPPDAVAGVNVATSGGSDLYGSSALGGVIDLIPSRPDATLIAGTLAGAAEDTTDAHGRVDLRQGDWGESFAGEGLRTAGYVPTAPQLAGAVDRAANVHYQTGRVVLERRFSWFSSHREAGSATALHPSEQGTLVGDPGLRSGRDYRHSGDSLLVNSKTSEGNSRSLRDDNRTAGLAGRDDRDGEGGGGALAGGSGFSQRVFVAGNLLNEARKNGTAVQTNGSRIWRWMAGDEWTAGERASGRMRVFGAAEGYRQSFSSINAARSVETLTRLQRTRTQEVGGSTDAAVHWGRAGVVVGADVRDLRANDVERPIARGVVSSVQTTPARQRFAGGFGEVLGTFGRWSGAASLRVDSAANLDTTMATYSARGVAGATTRVPDRSETVVSPRVGVVREMGRGFEAHGAGFRAFRAPSMNELYRQGQVGQELTLGNAELRSERATGADGGVSWRPASGMGAGRVGVEATYFWTEINRPVSAVLVARTVTTITNRRENLGQIESQGAEVRVQMNEGRVIWGMKVGGAVGYQYAHAVVTGFSAQPALVGKWIPQVPRQSVTMQMRAARERWGAVTVAGRASGTAFDDSSNVYPLHRFFTLDVYGERGLGRGWMAFVSVQNVLNQRMEVARTPLLTMGNPVLAQGGVRFGWGGR